MQQLGPNLMVSLNPRHLQTVSSIHSFVLAMVLYPEVQRKAQEEIDDVVGSDRLPTFADRESLPYINALCAEILRWIPVGPLGTSFNITKLRSC